MTRYPVASHEDFQAGDFGRATGYFPLVGFVAGLDILLFRLLALFDKNGLHYPIWCMLTLLFWVWSSDSLHLDGLADTSDALASRRQGTEFLGVLHDSRSGAFGVLAIGLALIAKYVWLSSLPMQFEWFLPLPLVFSRLHSAMACQIRPYAGNPGSLSSLFITEARHGDLSRAAGWSVLCFFALAGPGIYFGLATVADALQALGVCVGGLALGRILVAIPMRRLGGISGDLLGWSQVITELAIAFGLTLLLVK